MAVEYQYPGHAGGKDGLLVVQADSAAEADEKMRRGEGQFIEKKLTWRDAAVAGGAMLATAPLPYIKAPATIGMAMLRAGLGAGTMGAMYDTLKGHLQQEMPDISERLKATGEDVEFGTAAEAGGYLAGKYVLQPAIKGAGRLIQRMTPVQAYRLLGVRPPEHIAAAEKLETARAGVQTTQKTGQEKVRAATATTQEARRTAQTQMETARTQVEKAKETVRTAKGKEVELKGEVKSLENIQTQVEAQRAKELLQEARTKAKQLISEAGPVPEGGTGRLAVGGEVEKGVQQYLQVFREQNRLAFSAITNAIGNEAVVEMPQLVAAIKANREGIEKILYPMYPVERLAGRLESTEATVAAGSQPKRLLDPRQLTGGGQDLTPTQQKLIELMNATASGKAVKLTFEEADAIVSFLGNKGYSSGELMGNRELGIMRHLHSEAKKDLWSWLGETHPGEAASLKEAKMAYRQGRELLESSVTRALDKAPHRAVDIIFGSPKGTLAPEQVLDNIRTAKKLLPGEVFDKIVTGWLGRSIEAATSPTNTFSPITWAKSLSNLKDVLPAVLGEQRGLQLRAMIEEYAQLSEVETLAKGAPITAAPVGPEGVQAAQQATAQGRAQFAAAQQATTGAKEGYRGTLEAARTTRAETSGTSRAALQEQQRVAAEAQMAMQQAREDLQAAQAELRKHNIDPKGPWGYGQTRFFWSLLAGGGGGYYAGGGKGMAIVLGAELAARSALARPWDGKLGRFALDTATQLIVQGRVQGPTEVRQELIERKRKQASSMPEPSVGPSLR